MSTNQTLTKKDKIFISIICLIMILMAHFLMIPKAKEFFEKHQQVELKKEESIKKKI